MNLDELLAQKELDLTRVRKEVECLRIAATLLCDNADDRPNSAEEVSSSAEGVAEPRPAELSEPTAVQKVMGIFRKRSA
ncbi:MAG TPA: hypothetical protein VFA68_11530 [Terriglobales bacterium]|nr:hypothetical protein [Terriglobales bacterium]